METMQTSPALTPENEDACRILLAIWRRIDFSNMPASRRMGIYDEFQARIRSAAMCRDDQGLGLFVQRLCDKLGVPSITDEALVTLSQDPRVPEFLRLFREEAALLVLMLRVSQQDKKLRKQLDAQEGSLL